MLMRTLMTISLLFTGVAFGKAEVIDLGEYANTYPVKEKSFKASIKEGLAEVDTDEIKKSFIKSVDRLIEAKYNLPLSEKEQAFSKKNTYTVPFDMYSPDGILVYKKNEEIISTLPQGKSLDLCFIDARYPEILPYMARQFGECIYFIANNRIDKEYPEILKNSIDGKIYPVSEKYITRFRIEEFPTKIHLHEDKIDYRVLNLKQILKDYKMGVIR